MYVKRTRLLYHILVLVTISFGWSCATPVGPTGGPRDSVGPKVLSTEPETGSTNFRGSEITFNFDEYVNRNTARQNITIEPDLGLAYTLDWRRKSLTVKFEDPIPDSTTVILTLGADISDTRNNKLGKPIQVAFSTGDEIDQGVVTGRIRNADDGDGIEGATVLLYRAPVNITERAIYKAQTDTGGYFQFSYLGEGEYQAMYLEDRNRNKIWEESSENAQPFSTERIQLIDDDSVSLAPLYLIQTDTLAPKLQAVGMFSANRLRFRFDEDVELQDSAAVAVNDSSGNLFSQAVPLYVSKQDPFVLFGYSNEATSETSEYSVTMRGVTDAAGNEVITRDVTFQGSAQEDTTFQRIISTQPTGLYPYESLEIIYADVVNDPMITDSLVVSEGEVIFTEWPATRTEGNKLYIDPQEDTWIEGVSYQFLIWDPATQRRKLFEPGIWDFTEMGGMEVRIEGADSAKVYTLELQSDAASFRFRDTFTRLFLKEDLAPVNYILRVFEDVNGNGQWDPGSVDPYRSPEPYFVRKNIAIRSGFTSEVIITF